MRARDFLNENDDEELLKEILSHDIAEEANRLF
jgi:hypothetical protein